MKVSVLSRLTSAAFLLGSAVLIVIWVVSPAASAPQDAAAPAPVDRVDAPPDTIVEPVRLPEVEAPPPEYDVPVRNPFAFESRPRPSRAAEAPPVAAVVRPELPVLVAIVTDSTGSGDAHRAALSDGSGAVRIVETGDAFGGFTIATIGARALTLVDSRTDDTFQLALR